MTPDLVIRWLTTALDGKEDIATPAELIDGIARGEFQIFIYPKGCVVTQIQEQFGRRRLLVFLLSGEDLHEWQSQATADLKAYCNANGIRYIDAYARPGLEKVLKSDGWKKKQILLELDAWA